MNRTVFPLLKLHVSVMCQFEILKGALRKQSFLHPIFNSQNSIASMRRYPEEKEILVKTKVINKKLLQ